MSVNALRAKSRFLIVQKISNKDTQTLVKALRPLIKELREEKRIESITTDNTSEFVLLSKLESYGIQVYYAHAYHSWEKGVIKDITECYEKGIRKNRFQRSEGIRNTKMCFHD